MILIQHFLQKLKIKRKTNNLHLMVIGIDGLDREVTLMMNLMISTLLFYEVVS
ncbi:hypothetical protein BAZSYMA_ACONTIG192262_0 [Bathymodiolus azoricus thioautotrophic gill symbiont]|uniref:Uncharacterized protein n=1 Tax=Bathymodiolus azoricus thioautotrophic gill symbiont TaxID=235205 RepID=A0A1H6MCX5_9GAMM|nr:hypothetical protein BAZSYMA_ACONTIG192262_0 [Bathymodiolus azoricus thioautotrophic gill symbiont]